MRAMSVMRRKHIATRQPPAGNARRSLVVPGFLPEAEKLRTAFDERFADPRSTDPERFVWDYWHMPEQYTYLRTYGDRYFPEALTKAFMERLREWGREVLGCGSVSPPWFSYYVEGCVQELHADVPHGPWAYVFSLTRWAERGFTGGETVLLRPESLDFWHNFDPGRDLEAGDMVERIPSPFNQLTVFDARIPHGVRMVRGTHDPLDSRVVLHGWFKYPELTACAELQDEKSMVALRLASTGIAKQLEELDPLAGMVTTRVEFGGDGTVREVRVLSNTLVSTSGDDGGPARAVGMILDAIREIRLPAGGGGGWAILPFRLEPGR
jgi:hypothetical protein